MAGLAAKADPANRLVLGMAEYRQGHFADAVNWLQDAADLDQESALTVQACAMPAMVEQQLNQTNQGRASLASAKQLAEAKVPRLDGSNWEDEFGARLLLREAQALIPGASRAGNTDK